MTSFRRTLEVDIHQQLPSLPAAACKKLLDKLLEVAETVEDLPQLEISDIAPPLKLLQARKLVKFFKQKYDETDLQPPSMDRAAQWVKETSDQPRGPLESPSDDDNQSETGSRDGEGETPHLLKSIEAMSMCSASSILPQDAKLCYDSGGESLLDEHHDDGVGCAAKEVPGEHTTHSPWRPHFPSSASERADGSFPADGTKTPMLHSNPSTSSADVYDSRGAGPAEHGVRSTLSSSKSSLENEEAHRSYTSHIGSMVGRNAVAYGIRPSNTPAFTKEEVVRMYGSQKDTRANESAGTQVVRSMLSTDTSSSTIEETAEMFGSDSGDYGRVHEEAGVAVFPVREGSVFARTEELKTCIAVEKRRKSELDNTVANLEYELEALGLEDRESSMPIGSLRKTSSVPPIDYKVMQGSDTANRLTNIRQNTPSNSFRNIHEAGSRGKPARVDSSQTGNTMLVTGSQYSSFDSSPQFVGNRQDRSSAGEFLQTA